MNTNGQNAMSGTGYLLVRVSTAQGAIPVQGAKVTIRDDLGMEVPGAKGSVIAVMTTDRDGRTQRIALAAPPKIDGLSPGGAVPYATYNIDVEALGYYNQFFHAVPVYDTITSIQPALLVPIAQNGNQDGISSEDTNFDSFVNPTLRPRNPDQQER